MSDQNKAAVRAIFANNDQNQSMDWGAERVAPGFVVHLPGMPPMDVEGYRAFGNGFYTACPGLRHELHEIVAEGDMVGLRLTVFGAHTKPFAMPAGEIPPTGKELVIESLNMFRFADGKVAEQWVSFDMLGVMQTLGVIPA